MATASDELITAWLGEKLWTTVTWVELELGWTGLTPPLMPMYFPPDAIEEKDTVPMQDFS
jgi:hypothetical protein